MKAWFCDTVKSMYYTYILLSEKDKRTYVGYTSNLDERLKRHNEGRVKATKNRRPLKFFYTEEFKTIAEAKERELWWKSHAGRKKLKELFS
ncbi:MAG: GIY-YIG nuclease family protein [Patescibacteria group bacterium]